MNIITTFFIHKTNLKFYLKKIELFWPFVSFFGLENGNSGGDQVAMATLADTPSTDAQRIHTHSEYRYDTNTGNIQKFEYE